MTFFLTYLLTLFLTYLLTFFLTHFAAEVRRGTLASQNRSWGPARNTEHTGSRLRSGAEHWPHRIAVEVRRRTLNTQDRGWGPARNTGLTGSRLRSGAEHWPHIIARGDGGRDEGGAEEEEEAEEEEVTADIKSNNPHLTGGEKHWKLTWQWTTTMNEDVFPIENGDFPMSCWFSGGSSFPIIFCHVPTIPQN